MVAVIGDVHGCYFTLKALYNNILAKYPGIEVYCVGDLIDRGRNSYEVVKFFIDYSIPFTPGNHDFMFYAFVREPDSLFARSWVYNGNEATLHSYLNHYDSIAEHIEYLHCQPLFYDLDDCFISHAGISERYKKQLLPGMKVDIEMLESLIYSDYKLDTGVLWTRDKLMNIGKLQVVGHSKQNNVRVDTKANAVYIDTGAFAGLKLSSVIIHQGHVIDIIEEPTHQDDI
ncbi:MAG: metallophosphoesterase [Syntrophothermus sp.]